MPRPPSAMNGPPRTIAVLRFRTIARPAPDRWFSPDILSADRLDDMMGWLRRAAWRAITAEELARGLDEPGVLPERAVLITFDGGGRSLLDEGIGVLRRYRFPAVTFVPTDFVGQRIQFDELDEPFPVCTWEELRLLERNHISIQSLGAGRRRFAWLDLAQQEREVGDSRDAIGTHVGKPARLFAYPDGDLGRDPEAAARIVRQAGYRAAFVKGGGVNVVPGADPYRLARIMVTPTTDLAHELGE